MNRDWWGRFGLLVFFVILAVALLTPSALKLPADSKYPLSTKLNLGLDLQGGLYIVLGIDFNKVYRDEIKGQVQKMILTLEDQGIKATLGTLDSTDTKDPHQALTLANPTDLELAKNKIKDFYGGVVRLTGESANELSWGLNALYRETIEDQGVSKSIEVIRNRIDEFGVTEPEIVAQGKDRIVVQLPGVKDIDRAKNLIGQTAKLEFKMVNDELGESKLSEMIKKVRDGGLNYKKGERFSEFLLHLNEKLKDELPKGFEIVFERTAGSDDVGLMMPYLVTASAAITGEDLQDAFSTVDQQDSKPVVSMTLKSNAATRFEELSGGNIGKRMAIILDGNVVSAPVFQSRIPGGRAQISMGQGSFDDANREARELALVLRAGALPVQLDFEEQRIVGPSLGADSIRSAQLASVFGCLVLFVCALIYYKKSGAIAIITLILNVVFTMACMAALGATLTLPGIAGIALTVGMAIDGNIIIYERIREEIKKGLRGPAAVTKGFENAFWTIVDANITTALAGFCLLQFGTGPVRGFAVTLLIGIAVTVYCCYFVTKVLFELYMSRGDQRTVSI